MSRTSMNFSLVPRALREAASKGVFRVVVIIGGVKSSLLRYYLSLPNVIVIVIDNAVEIYRLRARFRGKRFISFVLGEGHTTRSAYSRATDERRLSSELTASTNFAGGFGSRGSNAEIAAELLVATHAFQDFLASLPDEAFARTKGKLHRIILYVAGSLAGAAAAGAKPVLLSAIVPGLLQIGIPVEVRQDLLGPMTFACVAKRARPNYAVSLFKTLYQMLKYPGTSHDLATHCLSLHNLPPFFDDVYLRDRCLLLDAVGLDSIPMEQYGDLVGANFANDGVTGSISHRVVDFMIGLDTAQHIAGPAASNLSAELKNRLEEILPDPLLVKDLTWSDESREQKRETIDEILDRFSISDDQSIERAITKAPASYRFHIQMLSGSNVEFPLDRLSTDFAVTPESLEEFDQRMRLIRTFQERLGEEEDIVRVDLDDVGPKIETATKRLHRLLYKLRDRSRLSGSQFAKLRLVAEVLRENWDRLHKLNAELQAIERASSNVDHEWDHHHGTLQAILKTLESHIPTSMLAEKLTSVATRPLNESFPQLLRIAELPIADQIDALCSFAGSITTQGLARCVGSSSDRLEDIARAFKYGRYDIESPSHDARVRECASDKVIYCSPSMEPKLEASFTKILHTLEPNATVTFYDTLMFGACVMRIRFQRFSHVGELFTGLVGHDLKVGLEDPMAALDSAEVAEMLRFFGARIEGDRVVFPEPRGK